MIRINATPGRLVLTPRHESAEEMGGLLRRFGLALVRDNKLICDDGSARALVDNLSRRALIAASNGEGPGQSDARLRLFCLFIRFYRRHMRLAAAEEAANEGVAGRLGVADPQGPGNVPGNVERAVRGLPLELRESLLLVVLERLSHAEAAEALEIPLATLVERLARARAMLAATLTQQNAAPNLSRAHPPPRGAPHLRLVK
jgi:RNA polymerase sigma-70 factor (ECF subfamily)